MFEFIIPGKPIAQKRPRLSRGCVYNPNAKEKATLQHFLSFELANLGILSPLEGPLSVELKVDSIKPKKMRESALNQVYDMSRPDIDNFIKFYLDVMNGIAYKDDAQVVKILGEKKYSDTSKVKIKIEPL